MRIVAPHAEKTIGSVSVSAFKPNAHRSVSAFLRYLFGPAARQNRMAEIRWERYPIAAELDAARAWLVLQRNLGLAANTIDAYGRALEEYLSFSVAKEVSVITAPKGHICRVRPGSHLTAESAPGKGGRARFERRPCKCDPPATDHRHTPLLRCQQSSENVVF